MLLAVGELYIDELNPESVRMATGFSAGLGDTQEELCGAVSGGVMVIGGLFGRSRLSQDDQQAIILAKRYRTWFLGTFGHTQCRELREQVVKAPGGLESCAVLVERAARGLMPLLEEVE